MLLEKSLSSKFVHNVRSFRSNCLSLYSRERREYVSPVTITPPPPDHAVLLIMFCSRFQTRKVYGTSYIGQASAHKDWVYKSHLLTSYVSNDRLTPKALSK